MENKKVTQEDINRTVWKACDTFRGVIDPSQYKDYILTMLFLKYVSDVYKSKLNDYLDKYEGDKERAERIPQEEASEVKCMFTDRSHRIWVCTKEDRTVRLFSQTDGHLIGYLSAGGTLQPGYTRFTASIYSIHQSPDGTIWLGSKPDGIFRLNETSPGHFTVHHITQLPDPNVYSITTDEQRHHRRCLYVPRLHLCWGGGQEGWRFLHPSRSIYFARKTYQEQTRRTHLRCDLRFRFPAD